MYRKNLKDEFYTRKSRADGYPARSVYKLEEINQKHKLIKKGDIVMDLGASPGSWTLYTSKIVGKEGRVLSIDLENLKFSAQGNVIFVKRDILKLDQIDLKNWEEKFDVVMADLAPKTSGVISMDVGRSLELSEKAFEIAKLVLKEGGNFITKIFEGEGVDDFAKEVEKSFKVFKRARPQAIIKHSKEFYIVAKGYEKQRD